MPAESDLVGKMHNSNKLRPGSNKFTHTQTSYLVLSLNSKNWVCTQKIEFELKKLSMYSKNWVCTQKIEFKLKKIEFELKNRVWTQKIEFKLKKIEFKLKNRVWHQNSFYVLWKFNCLRASGPRKYENEVLGEGEARNCWASQ